MSQTAGVMPWDEPQTTAQVDGADDFAEGYPTVTLAADQDPCVDEVSATSLAVIDGDSMAAISEPLSLDDARTLTEKIRSTADVLYVLIYRAHAGRAHEALGYSSFAAYVTEEFHISRSRAYQMIDQARLIEAIEAAAPDGTEVHISEAAARDLKQVLGEVLPEVEARTSGLGADEAGAVVEEIVEDYREKQRERREAAEAEQDDLDARSEGRGDYSGPYEGDGDYRAPREVAPVYDEEEIDAAQIRRNVQAAYDLYSSLAALKSMPEVQAVIDTIPVERRMQINDSLDAAAGWLEDFRTTWASQFTADGQAAEGAQDEDADDEYEDDGDFDA